MNIVTAKTCWMVGSPPTNDLNTAIWIVIVIFMVVMTSIGYWVMVFRWRAKQKQMEDYLREGAEIMLKRLGNNPFFDDMEDDE